MAYKIDPKRLGFYIVLYGVIKQNNERLVFRNMLFVLVVVGHG